MSLIIIVLQGKGGSRKSTTVIHLAHWLRGINQKFRLADLEYQDRLTMRYDPTCLPVSPDIEELLARKPQAMQLPTLMREGANLLIDCGGGSFQWWDRLLQMDDPPLLRELRQKGVRFTIIVPVCADQDSQQGFNDYDDFFAEAQPTKLLATFGASDRNLPGFPSYPAELTLNLPELPRLLHIAISVRSQPAGVLAKLPTEELGFPHGWATNADLAYAAEFQRLIQYLTP